MSESAGSLATRASGTGAASLTAAALPAQAAAGTEDVARTAGRGGIAIAAAKLFFIVVGLGQQIALTRVLGLQDYGMLGRAQSIGNVFYNPVVTASIQGVSRAVAQAPDAAREEATRKALSIHAGVIVPFAALFILAAPWIAEAFNAAHITTTLRILGGVVFVYGLYAPLVGVLNGTKRFTRQAALDSLFAVLRTVGLLAGAWYFRARGLGVEAAMGGFVIAAAVILLVALASAGVGKAGPGGPTAKEHLAFIGPLFAGQFALNLLFQSDLQLLGKFAADAAVAKGLEPKAADTLVGAYRNAQLFCFLPYQLLLSVTFVLFPLLAQAHRDKDAEAVQSYVRTGVRLALVLAGMMVGVTAAIPGPLLRLVFGPESAALGSKAMFVMALGLGSFAIFGILTTVLTSLKRERASAALTLAALGLVVALCWATLGGQPYGEELLVRTALSTGVGLLGATLLAALLVARTAGGVVPPITVVRVGLALAATIAVGSFLPAPGKLLTVAYATALVVLYVAVLVGTRELGRADVANIMAVVGRRKTPG